jgi:hypothetical protein
MDPQIVAAIITGIFGLITGILVAKSDSISLRFLNSERTLKPNWRGFAQRVAIENEQCSLKEQMKCELMLHQRGRRVSGTMKTEVKDSSGKMTTFIYQFKGRMEGDYIHCELLPEDKHLSRIRKALFVVHSSGERMNGVFIGSRASEERIVLGRYRLESY